MQDIVALMDAYQKVMSEARHLMAQHSRMQIRLGAMCNDAENLRKAIENVEKQERAFRAGDVTVFSGG
jgi:hypothetical protein